MTTGNPAEKSRGRGERKVTVLIDCEGKEKLLNEVRGYQVVTIGGSTEGQQGGPQEELAFHTDEPPRLLGEGQYPQPLTYIAGGIGS